MSLTPSTSGTRSAPGSASQRRPAASAAYSPGATSARVLTNAERLVLELHAERVVDVAAADALEAADLAAGGGANGVSEAHRAGRGTRPRPGRARSRSRAGRRSTGRARRGRARRRCAGRTRAAAGSSRARPAGAIARRSRRFSRSAASSRSKSSKSRGVTCRAAPSSVMPRARAASVARRSGGSPACQPPVPALSISISCSSPASRTSERMTPSAVGERQMLPMQMNRTRVS